MATNRKLGKTTDITIKLASFGAMIFKWRKEQPKVEQNEKQTTKQTNKKESK